MVKTMSVMERFYNSVAVVLGWVFFVGAPVAAFMSIWLYDWRWIASAIVVILTLFFIGVGAKLCINDEKSAS